MSEQHGKSWCEPAIRYETGTDGFGPDATDEDRDSFVAFVEQRLAERFPGYEIEVVISPRMMQSKARVTEPAGMVPHVKPSDVVQFVGVDLWEAWCMGARSDDEPGPTLEQEPTLEQVYEMAHRRARSGSVQGTAPTQAHNFALAAVVSAVRAEAPAKDETTALDVAAVVARIRREAGAFERMANRERSAARSAANMYPRRMGKADGLHLAADILEAAAIAACGQAIAKQVERGT